jgi:NTP pyrophosphatase (non-canonical NTP hydrolase)
MTQHPHCTGTYTADEFDPDGPGTLVHSEYTSCPVHDEVIILPSSMYPYPQGVKQRCAELADNPTTMDEMKEALAQAAKVIEDLDNEVSHMRKLEVSELHAIWWELRRVMYGYTTQKPDDMEESIQAMPQEWDLIQEAVKRLQEQPFSLDDYQRRCGDTANYPEAGTGSITAITYCVLGLAGEAGEVADKWKKVLRGDHGDGVVPQEVKDLMVKEVGDTTWYSARLSFELGVALSKVAQGNLDKLASRKERGVIKGSGDLR